MKRRKLLTSEFFDAGIEFPCGGTSACGGCKIRIVEGEVPITPMMRDALTPQELADGWRLACCSVSDAPVTVEVSQWSVSVLTDESDVGFEARSGVGTAVDLGTTTIVAQKVDLATGEVLDVRTMLNPQAQFGADVMTRLQYELQHPGLLTRVIRDSLGPLLKGEVLLAGNTAMHHLYCGLDVEPLTRVPFESPHLRHGSEFLPCLGGFVGSDLLAGIVATGIDELDEPHVLFDIGTNGEIVVASRNGIVCASTAAGPAFEGGKISCGMRAGHGAIDRVEPDMSYHVIGGGAARGICGSGLVDAVAAALQNGFVSQNGRMKAPLPLGPVSLTQADIRELQLAKGAMAAGLKMLAGGARKLFLAGAFGNYIRLGSARAIGLLPENLDVEPVGNSSLRGTRMLLLSPSHRQARIEKICAMTRHVELAADPAFQDIYAESMALKPFRL